MRERTTRLGRLACTLSCRAATLATLLLTAIAVQAAPFAYITNFGGVITVIDVATNAVVASVGQVAGAAPFAVAINPTGTRAYVANTGTNNVVVVDLAISSLAPAATVAVGSNPRGVALNPADTRVYVANQDSNNVSVIDTATNTVVTTVAVGVAPRGVDVNPAGTRVYVANGGGSVSVIDTASNTVIATVATGGNPFGVAVNPAGTFAYVTHTSGNSVSIIDTATNTPVGTVTVGTFGQGVAINPAGTRVYVVNSGPDNVSVIDTATNTVIATVAVGINPVGVTVTPDGTRAYVANFNNNSLSVIDTATNTLLTTVFGFDSPAAYGRFIGEAGVPGVDTTPDPFTFTDVTGVALSTLIVSNTVTITGINAASPISVTGGEYSIGCSGTFTTVAGTITNGQTACVRHTSSGTPATATNTTLTVGGVSDTFTSTTAPLGVDTTPDPFTFTDVTGVALSTLVVSNTVTITGITAASPISVTGGEYSIGCSGTFTAVAGTITNGQTVCVRHTSSGTPATATNTTLTVGGVSDTFTSTTAGIPPGAQQTTEIPTLSQWTLILLALGLGAFGVLRLRRPV